MSYERSTEDNFWEFIAVAVQPKKSPTETKINTNSLIL